MGGITRYAFKVDAGQHHPYYCSQKARNWNWWLEKIDVSPFFPCEFGYLVHHDDNCRWCIWTGEGGLKHRYWMMILQPELRTRTNASIKPNVKEATDDDWFAIFSTRSRPPKPRRGTVDDKISEQRLRDEKL
eukprot:259215_1